MKFSERTGVLLIGADPFLLQSSARLIALAAQHRIPAVYNTREFVAGGGSRDHATSLFFMSTAALEAAAHLPLQHDQLMSECRVLCLKSALRLERRGEQGQEET